MKEYSVSEIAVKINDASIVLLDVRICEERNHGCPWFIAYSINA